MIPRKQFIYFLLFTVLTCGIYGYVVLYQLTRDVNTMTGPEEGEISPGLAVLFSILTLGVYEYWWFYRMGLKTDRLSDVNGIAREDSASGYLLWALMGIFTLGITRWIAYYKFIKQFNRLADAYNSVWMPRPFGMPG